MGRLTVSQIYEMFTSERLAISDDARIFIAPLRYNVHNIYAGRELKIGESRLDLMTVENGIQANNLGSLFHHLFNKNKNLANKTKNNMHILIELYKLNGININPIVDIKSLENKRLNIENVANSIFNKDDDEIIYTKPSSSVANKYEIEQDEEEEEEDDGDDDDESNLSVNLN